MIIAYPKYSGSSPQMINSENLNALKDAIWIDLLSPTHEEEMLVEQFLGLDVPTKEEMQEIELSSRLYKENNALFMTVTMVDKSDTEGSKNDVVTLIVTNGKLVTVRYIEPLAFAIFISRLAKFSEEIYDARHLVMAFLDIAIDRLADILEQVGHRIDEYSQLIFHPIKIEKSHTKHDYKYLLQTIGTNGDLNSKAHESLVSFDRLVVFFEQATSSILDSDANARLKTMSKDIQSLNNHASFLSSKINFLLDATLGMVNIEQNSIIKIFSIVAVILLPPTLIASIYGMNFQYMPELSWRFGYPIAIGCMLISAWLPYKYFKKRNWL